MYVKSIMLTTMLTSSFPVIVSEHTAISNGTYPRLMPPDCRVATAHRTPPGFIMGTIPMVKASRNDKNTYYGE